MTPLVLGLLIAAAIGLFGLLHYATRRVDEEADDG